ncbi:hypothetical protein K435DRAFT_835903 [Dendrothele bispora CBS 962.96]|uniref:Uncharacterized protein n=1 Tax=Dendrothele bispora (strain CBS 962.96) TaxID=1314807 RepID=A0A4V4HHM7_DENBC|nr:hypothetical protein K435DRAFT_835903 [Dendrothele bispora CBS 962.96]
MTVDEVLDSLVANPGQDPEAAAFVGLFRLLPTDAPGQDGTLSSTYFKSTPRFPHQQILTRTWTWTDASEPLPPNTQTYRIYDAREVDASKPMVLGLIPLYLSLHPVYQEQHWRLERSTGLLLTFALTHLTVTLLGTPNNKLGYDPPVECVKTAQLLTVLQSIAFNSTPTRLPTIAEGNKLPRLISDQPSVNIFDELDELADLEQKETIDRKMSTSNVKNYLSSISDIKFDFTTEPIDDFDTHELETLAPHPIQTPLEEGPDESLDWIWGPHKRANDIILSETNRIERDPCYMKKQFYSIENGTITFSDGRLGIRPSALLKRIQRLSEDVP